MVGSFTIEQGLILGILMVGLVLWCGIPVMKHHRFRKRLSLLIQNANSRDGMIQLASFLSTGHNWVLDFESVQLVVPQKFFVQCPPELCANLFTVILPKFSAEYQYRVRMRERLSAVARQITKEPEHYSRTAREQLRLWLRGGLIERNDPVGILFMKINQKISQR